jgi:hypothetical protein
VRFFLATIFAGLAAWLWWYVYHSVTSGLVQKPRGNAWWRDPCYYERGTTPVRFWSSVAIYLTLAALASVAGIQCLFLQS